MEADSHEKFVLHKSSAFSCYRTVFLGQAPSFLAPSMWAKHRSHPHEQRRWTKTRKEWPVFPRYLQHIRLIASCFVNPDKLLRDHLGCETHYSWIGGELGDGV